MQYNACAQVSFTGVMLILSNLIPLFGVLFLGWEVFIILLIYWLENVVVGTYNVIKMLSNKPREISAWFSKIFFIPFFIVHYGLFTAGHGVFVFSMFGGKSVSNETALLHHLSQLLLTTDWLLYAIAALVISHGISLFKNYYLGGDYKRVNLNTLMFQPYVRVVILHVTILLGGLLVLALDLPVAGLVVLIFLKLSIDYFTHNKMRQEPLVAV